MFTSGNIICSHRTSIIILTGIRFDIILCRNIFLYLNPNSIERVIDNLLSLLNPGGYIITGLAEGAISERLKSNSFDGFRNIFKF